jgi:hypothetical protein
MEDVKNKKSLDNKLNSFLVATQDGECEGDECVIKTDKSLVERINKKIVTDDGRELLM